MTNIKFYKNRKKLFCLSSLIIILGFIYCFVVGVKVDIQFKGGSLVSYNFTGEIDLEKATDIITEAIDETVVCQENKSIADDKKTLVVSVAGNEALSSEKLQVLKDALVEEYPNQDIELESSSLVNPFIGKEALMKGLWALVIASVLIVIYVWIRFRSMSGPSAGMFALMALIHDIIISFFAFVMMGSALNETLIAVILTIVGYSINDTIIIYDRIRENEKNNSLNLDLPELVDLSINQSLSRSIHTSICTFLAVAVAFGFAKIYGLSAITEFTFPMMIGILAGSYSSIALAAPLWVTWKIRGNRSGFEKK